MNDKIIKKTQDTLGKIIKKPPLTEKLLSKPPFRFLHDIITNVIKSTGFMKGLFTDSEMSSENVKDKDSKIKFLTKARDLVSLVLGKPIAAKPSKIVAGHEPEKTNEFLQAIAEAVNKKVDNDDYVRRVLKDDGEPAKPPSGKDREASSDRRKRKDKDKEREKDKEEEKEEKDKEKDRERRHKRDRKDREKSRDREKSSDRRSRDKDKENEGEDKEKKDKERRRRKEKEEGSRERRKEKEKEKEEEAGDENESSKKGVHFDTKDDEAQKKDKSSDREKSGRKRRGEKEHSTMNGELGEDDLPPQVIAARRAQRPSSARPAPPRVKKQDFALEEHAISGNAPNVIVDKKDDSSDEDEGFIAKEEDIPPPQIEETPVKNEDEDGEEHGGLVKKMLEKKKELEGGSQTQASKKTEIERPHVNDAARKKEREMVQKEIDKLRGSIQTLTRSANPLGKIMDFVQEDLDSMQKELEMWKKENKQNGVSLQREQSITENSIEPLKAQLTELDQQINDQLDLIAAVKSNILRNDEKIEKMLGTVTKS